MAKATEPKHKFIENRAEVPDYNALPADVINRAIYDMVGDEIRRGGISLLSPMKGGGVPRVTFATESADRNLEVRLDVLVAAEIEFHGDASHPEDVAYVEYLRGILAATRKKWRPK